VKGIHELEAAGGIIHRHQNALSKAARRQCTAREIEVFSATENNEGNRNSDERSHGQGQATSFLQNASDLNLQSFRLRAGN
ncbi:MAG TPA: hypothetical protein VGF62_07030, partial [Rhizomicrobium sp.]